uniref:Uncharacterized protein n=1 Tax=Arion vulgaris TaxID=1028688 RepID=A0A0B6YNX4_9EUPU
MNYTIQHPESHFTELQTSFIIAVAVWTMQFVNPDPNICSMITSSKRSMAYPTSKTLNMKVESE